MAAELFDHEPVEVYKTDARSRVWRIDVNGGDGLVIKRFEYGAARQWLGLLTGTHPAQRERRANRRLRRAGFAVVPIERHGVRGGKAWLATRWAGRSLKQVIQTGGRADAADRRRVGNAVADIAAGLIERGYFFRDLKTSNLIVDDAGGVRLIDVGAVRRSRRPDHVIRMLTMLDRTATEDGVRSRERLRCLRRVVKRCPRLGSLRQAAGAVRGVGGWVLR